MKGLGFTRQCLGFLGVGFRVKVLGSSGVRVAGRAEVQALGTAVVKYEAAKMRGPE